MNILNFPVSCHSYSPNMEYLAVATFSSSVFIYKVSELSSPFLELSDHDSPVTGIHWQQKLITCAEDRNCFVYTDFKPTLVLLRFQTAALGCRWSTDFFIVLCNKVAAQCSYDPENDWWICKHLKVDSVCTAVDFNDYVCIGTLKSLHFFKGKKAVFLMPLQVKDLKCKEEMVAVATMSSEVVLINSETRQKTVKVLHGLPLMRLLWETELTGVNDKVHLLDRNQVLEYKETKEANMFKSMDRYGQGENKRSGNLMQYFIKQEISRATRGNYPRLEWMECTFGVK